MFFKSPKIVPFKNTEVYVSIVAFSKQNFHLGKRMYQSMKLWIFFIAFLGCACNNNSATNKIISKDSPVYYPYTAVHSNSFDKGNEQLSKNVLDIWRQYETGKLFATEKLFADSLRLILPDRIIEGSREQVIAQYQKRRDAFSDMQCFVYSWMPVHRADTKEDLVFVWGLYDGTKKNGDRDYAQVHEIWRFDKEGKIKEMEQFITHPH